MSLRWQDIVDFLVLGLALYALILWAKQARALRIAFGIVGLHAAATVMRRFDLVITGWVLDGAAFLATIALVLVFQPEVRRALTRLDSKLQFWRRSAAARAQADRAVAEAVFHLAANKIGAIIVLAGEDSIDELIDGGVTLRADISEGIIEAIFQKVSPLHDGAILIENNRILRAGIVLPLTTRADVPPHFGTRHRAAMGMAERSDACLLVASEERGDVHIMRGGAIHRIQDLAGLVAFLERIHSRPRQSFLQRTRLHLTVNWGLRLSAVGLTLLIWSMSSVFLPTTVRTVSVPIEFSYVPRGMIISAQSADRLEVQVRGSSLLMDSVGLTRLVARFDLSAAREGRRALPVKAGTIDLPPGMIMEGVTPDTVSLNLVRRQ